MRAWHEWMQDNGLTPYLLVKVDERVQVPTEHVKDGEIVLNISTDAAGSLHIGNDTISFQARFSGRVRDILVPTDCVVSIFARETGQGMGFDMYDFGIEEGVFDANADAYTYHADGTEKPDKSGGLSVVEKPSKPEKPHTATTSTPPKDPNKKGGKGSSNLRLID